MPPRSEKATRPGLWTVKETPIILDGFSMQNGVSDPWGGMSESP